MIMRRQDKAKVKGLLGVVAVAVASLVVGSDAAALPFNARAASPTPAIPEPAAHSSA